MIKKIFLKPRNWEKAGAFLCASEPHRFFDLAAAMEFLKRAVLRRLQDATRLAQYREYGDKDLPFWQHGKVLACFKSSFSLSSLGKTERTTISFWVEFEGDERPPTEVYF